MSYEMTEIHKHQEPCSLSIVIPCYNEEKTLETCIETVLAVFETAQDVRLEIVVVDDCSKDKSFEIAQGLAQTHPQITVKKHDVNRGKGAALRTGFSSATGDYVAIQDADLEYDPADLLRLLRPLRRGIADVVYGSRFLSSGEHRILYFWHSMGNRFLTFLSNMFTNLNLTDMETCYKVFKREVIQSIDLKEDRFGFEPEVTAKIAAKRVRLYEMGVSYYGRTYEEGKKIGARDGFRALYCILKYNFNSAPIFLQLLVYTLIGGVAAVFNLGLFALLLNFSVDKTWSAIIAFGVAAAINYALCVLFLFRHQSRWSAAVEYLVYAAVVLGIGAIDIYVFTYFIGTGMSTMFAKATACLLGLLANFAARKWLVFSSRD